MIVNNKTFPDHRGSLTCFDIKTWNQLNVSKNVKKFTFRGMHYQNNPRQEKLITVTSGKIVDFIYDLESKSLGCFVLNELESVYVHKNAAHGFITLEDNTTVSYLVNGKYNPNEEKSIIWNNIPDLKSYILTICKESEIIISDKDLNGK